jgi:hypothetical protein
MFLPLGLAGIVFVVGFFHHVVWLWGISFVVAFWAATVFTYRRKAQPTFVQIAEQLLGRGSFPFDLWGSASRAEFAHFVSGVVAEEIGWPNANFIPDDPLEILFFCPSGDGGEAVAILWTIEKEFGKGPEWKNPKTFGQFIDDFLRTMPQNAAGAPAYSGRNIGR